MIVLGKGHQVEARFGLFEIVLILMQYRCTNRMECTSCLEIHLEAPDGTPR